MVVRHSRVSARHNHRIVISQHKELCLIKSVEMGLQHFPLCQTLAPRQRAVGIIGDKLIGFYCPPHCRAPTVPATPPSWEAWLTSVWLSGYRPWCSSIYIDDSATLLHSYMIAMPHAVQVLKLMICRPPDWNTVLILKICENIFVRKKKRQKNKLLASRLTQKWVPQKKIAKIK